MKAIKFLTAGVIAAAIASPVFAKPVVPTWTVEPTASSPITLVNGWDQITLDGHLFKFTPIAGFDLAYYNGNPQRVGGSGAANDPTDIGNFIKASGLFGLKTSTILTNPLDSDGTPGVALVNHTFTINNAKPFDYLAVHVGGGELLFHWTTKITSFAISADNLSNFRAYASPVPEPETYAMMIAGLGLVGFMARRRKQK